MNDNQPKAASIAKVAVWERNDVPTLHESGKIDMDYLDALVEAGESTDDPTIQAKCKAQFAAHTRIFID